MDIAGKKVTIIGGKRSGMALARLVIRLNGKVQLSEKDSEDCLPHEFKSWAAQHNVSFEFNGHTPEFVTNSDVIVLSPGVPFDSKCVRWAQEKNICVCGEIEFAAQFCSKPIIAVTGSNGKTTVATLISKIFQKAGHQVCLCGNVGFPFSEFVCDLDHVDYVVLELSSFQLESVHDSSLPTSEGSRAVEGFKPYISVILKFSHNHLDRHKDLEEYFAAKKRITINQSSEDFCVLNYKDSESHAIPPKIEAQVVYFNSDDEMTVSNPNHSAVLAVGQICSVDKDLCHKVFKEFEGVEHRLEKVRSLNGVDFINDSKATTAQAALWALENIEQPILMICGGRDKNIDFSVLGETVQQKVKQMFVIGEARAKIRKAFDELINLEECDGLEEAITKARQNASKGDCVLLSPMCTSFDMFADFEERGRAFKKIVNNLT